MIKTKQKPQTPVRSTRLVGQLCGELAAAKATEEIAYRTLVDAENQWDAAQNARRAIRKELQAAILPNH
jgi:hypothetical protein